MSDHYDRYNGMEELLGMDCISRRKAINALTEWSYDNKDDRDAIDVINGLPPIQPKRGRWISADAIFGGVPFYCSECGENTRDTVMGKPRWSFCPNCGCRMDGGE